MSSIGDKLRGANGGIGSKLNPSGTTYEQTQRVLNGRTKNTAENTTKKYEPVNTSNFIKDKFLSPEEIDKRIYTLPDGTMANKNDYTAEEQQMLLSGEYRINPDYDPTKYMSPKLFSNNAQIMDTKKFEQQRYDNANALGKAQIVAGKVGNTVKDIGTSAILGPIQAAEGWTNTGLTVAANTANLVGAKDTADYLTNMIKIDAVGDAKKELDSSTQSGYGRYNPSVLGVDLSDISREGARMLTAGVAGMPGFIISAIGGNVQEALNEGQSLGRATIYGGITGTAEGIIEKLVDPFKLVGGGVLDKFLTKNVIARLATAPVGEFVEEWITQAINPFIKMGTYDANIENPFGSWDNFKEWFAKNNEAGWQGFVMGLFLQGRADISNAEARQEYKKEVSKAVNKIKGLTEQQKQETINELVKGAENSKIQIEEIMQNYKQNSQYDKYIPQVQEQNIKLPTSQKNVAQELPTTELQNPTQQTNRIEGKIAQTGNMEQTVDMSKMPENFMKNRATYEVETEKILPFMDDRMGHRENDKVEKLRENIKKNGIEKPIELRTNSKGEVTINDGHHRLQIAKELGIKNIPVQYLDENSQKMVETDNFKGYNDSIKERWNGNVDRTRGAISGQNQGSRFGTENSSYTSVLPGRTDTTTENDRLLGEVQGYNNRPSSDTTRRENIGGQTINEADTQSAFSMPKNYISPSQDMQKATEFVNKATVEDIDTLNKMVEEAEKYPDRVDLQFFAEKARETIEKLSRQQVRQAIMEETGLESYNLDDVNKISKAKMNFTTPVRVIEKIFNKETANKINENFFKPIKHNEAERIRRLNKERADIKELDIKPGSAEDAAIQKYGEGEYVDENGLTIPYTLENLKRDFPDTWQKLQNATNVIRSKYDTYLEEINEVLQDNGYDPIPKRKDYFRHFEELNDLFSVLGVPTKVDDIPTDLNGMTADLKPGKQFFANALQRKGKKTTYSAIKGIDGYLDGAMNILYHTKDIQKLRTLDKYIRDTYGQTKGLADANTMTDEQKAKRINQINEGHLSEFAAWLTEYTNALAGKKSRLDRGVEEMFGRKSYKYLNLIKKQVGANMTGLNLNSALSNFISVIQAGPKTSKKALLKGTVDTIKNIFTKDGFVDKSDFLTTRFGTDKIAKNWWQKAGDAGQIFMSGTDYFTANLITRSKYQEFIDKGYSETEAIKKADEFADRLMAGRGKGDLPTAFESKMLGIVTQFQLEVTNQLDSIFYDTLHEDYAAESNSKLAKEHPKFYNAASATFILGQLFALAFLYNEGKEELTGTEGGALDPIGTIVDAIKYLTDENLSKPEAIAKIVEDIANQLPFLSIFTSGGRIPIKEAFPDLLSVAKGEAKLGDEMWNLTNLLLPTGGGQLKKTTQGLNTFAKGGSYTKDAEGNPKLKYPVEQNFENLVKSMVFGKWATQGAKDYIDRGFKTLSAKQTEGYEKAMKAGITSEEFYKAYDAQRGIKGLGDLTSPYKKTKIDEATKGLNKQQRTILYDVFDISKTAQQSSKKVTDEQAKKQKEKLESEKQKELKGFNVIFNK